MSALFPLVFMWLLTQRAAVQRAPSEPQWPTAASPPPQPPIPAFQPQHGVQHQSTHATADTGTPLADLHNAPPAAPPADAGNVATAAAKHAANALKSKLPKVPKVPHVPGLSKSQPKKAVTVSSIQQILNARGAGLVFDGKYGPKTTAAWANLARSKNLPTYITRNGPTSVKVDSHTYDVLSVPPIP